MERAQYNACLRPFLTGSKSKEQRQLDFCAGAKVCSGKAKNEAEAKQICLTQPLRPPRERKSRRGPKASCPQDMNALAKCAAGNLTLSALTPLNMEATLAEALQKCGCGKVSRKEKAIAAITPEQMGALGIMSQMKTEYGGTMTRDMPIVGR